MSNVIKRSSKLTYFTIPVFAVILLGLYILPSNLDFSYQIKFVDLFVLIIIATMWNLLAGFGGLISVGQQAFIGIGAYSLVFFTDLKGQSVIVAMVCAVIFSGLVAIPLSFIVFRLKGGYFAIGTWVLAEIIKLVIVQIQSLGGGAGISLGAFAEIDRADRIKMVYLLALAVSVVILLGTFVLMRSRLGLALTAIRDDATAAGTLGVNVSLAQRTVFVIVAMGFAAAGSLIALTNLRVQPDDIFSVNYSAIMILGSILFFFIQERLRDYGSIYLIILGAVAILSVLLAPRGLWGLITRDKVSLFPTRYFISKKREG